MFEKLSVQELFPTPLWICDLTEAHHRRLNADLKARIEALIEPRPAIGMAPINSRSSARISSSNFLISLSFTGTAMVC